jgi:hypothetical protein
MSVSPFSRVLRGGLTAHSGGELKVLASAAEVEVGADKEVTGSTPGPLS